MQNFFHLLGIFEEFLTLPTLVSSGIRVAALPQLLQLLEQENGSFGHQLSPLLKEPSPCNLQDLFNCWANPSSILSRDDLDRQQKVLRETIENLQNQNFCEHAISHASLSLLETYTVVFAPDDHPLERLPDEIRCCHLLSVVQGLQNLLREFSYSQAEMYKGAGQFDGSFPCLEMRKVEWFL